MANDLAAISRKMRNLDLCTLTTQSAKGVLNSRPMSNNGDVKYDGNSFFFSYEKSQKVKDIQANPQVGLNFQGEKGLFISVVGKAKLLYSRAIMEKHWVPDLEKWFEDGLDTPGIVLIQVKAKNIKYWQKRSEGEIKL